MPAKRIYNYEHEGDFPEASDGARVYQFPEADEDDYLDDQPEPLRLVADREAGRADVVPLPGTMNELEEWLLEMDQADDEVEWHGLGSSERKMAAGFFAAIVLGSSTLITSPTYGEGVAHRFHQIEHIMGFDSAKSQPKTGEGVLPGGHKISIKE